MSATYPGGLITKTPVTPTNGVASGIWTLAEQAYWQKQGAWTVQLDPYFENVSLLLNGDGTNGSQNNTFVASGSVFDVFNASGTVPATYVDGNGDYLSSSITAIGTSDFTIEYYNYLTSHTGGNGESGYFQISASAGGLSTSYSAGIIATRSNPEGGSRLGVNILGTNIATTYVLPLNTWFHTAIVRQADSVKVYVNGTLVSTPTTISSNIPGTYLAIGGYYDTGYLMNGYISQFRIVKSAVYTGDFTRPANPLTAITNTVILTCQNTTLVDNSLNNFTITANGNAAAVGSTPATAAITRNGNTTQGSFSPYGSNWGVYFSGSQNFIAPTQTAIGTNDFTLEGWVNVSAFTNRCALIMLGTNSTQNGPLIQINTNGLVDGQIRNGSAVTGSYVTSSSAIPIGVWTHIAFVRTSGTLTLYINGISSGTPVTNTTNCDSTLGCVGAQYPDFSASGRGITGYISNARVVRNQALFSGTFTPSTAPLTTGTVGATGAGAASSITGTVSFLVCNENRFATSWTFDGTPSVQRFSPFNPTAPYSTSVIGGSGYFDGSGDYLTTPTTGQFTAAGDFTVGIWVYPLSLAAASAVVGNYTSNVSTDWVIDITTAGAVRYYTNGATVRITSATGAVKINQWNYISLSRSGTTLTGYVNGTSAGTYTQATTFGSATKTIYIGVQSGPSEPLTGYLSDVKLIDGSAVTTIPTAPQTATTGTNLLLNFTNAGIPDLAMQNNLETVGNAQVSTSVKKYGTGSLAFDGTGDYLALVNSPNTALGSGDFTIEMWVYSTATGTAQNFIDTRNGSSAGWVINKTVANQLTFYSEVTAATVVTAALTANQWVHVTIVRNSGTITLYLDGTSANSAANTSSYTSQQCVIGTRYTKDQQYYTGYLDDVRITKGVARYSGSSFTPPASALPKF